MYTWIHAVTDDASDLTVMMTLTLTLHANCPNIDKNNNTSTTIMSLRGKREREEQY